VNQQAIALDEGVATRFTLPKNPLTLSRSRVVCCSDPRGIVCELGLSEIVKSELEGGGPGLTVTVRVADADTVPPVAITVT